MSDRLRVLRDERMTLVTQMRSILDKAETEKRAPSAEESTLHAELFGKTEGLRTQIEMVERQDTLDREAATRAAQQERQRIIGAGDDVKPEMRALRNYLLGGAQAMTTEDHRALQVDVGTAGGYLVAPLEFVDGLIKNVDDLVFMRAKATKYRQETADGIGVPTLAADPDDADWTGELSTGNEDASMAFGTREMRPHPLAKRIKVSKKLVRSSTLDVVGLVQARLAYKFGISQEKGFMTGNGARQPLGVFTASADGIPTSRDVSTGNTTTAIAVDGLIEAKYKIKGAYWPNCEWIFHRDAVKQLSKLKDGDGQYLWRPSVLADEPDMLLGRPINISEYAPNTFTTGLYVGIIGDFSYYWIVDALDLQIQRLIELYAEANQDGFIGRMETDGAPVLPEAFARVTLA